MEKTIITTGKTIDLAIEAALNQLGLDRDSVSVEVLAQAKSGFLGLGAQPAKVQVTYEVPDPAPEAPKVALSSASRSKPKAKPAAPKAEAPKAEPKVEAPKPEPKAEKKPEPKKEAPKAEKQPKAPKENKAPKAPKEAKAPVQPREYAAAEPGSVEEKMKAFGRMMAGGSQFTTHIVSYVGQWKQKAVGTYIEEFWTHVPAANDYTTEISAINGKIGLSIHQMSEDDQLMKLFFRQLEENDIPYTLKAKMPSDVAFFQKP